MGIKFCPKCRGILMFDKEMVVCSNCGFSKVSNGVLSSSEKIPQNEERGDGAVKGENTFATYEHECSKCGYNKAQVVDCGVFYSDEDNLIFLKCGKCGFSERVGKES